MRDGATPGDAGSGAADLLSNAGLRPDYREAGAGPV